MNPQGCDYLSKDHSILPLVRALFITAKDYPGNPRRHFSISFPTRLVSVAAFLRRYLPSSHSLFKLLNYVFTLES
jgi:hypothetical protein